MYFRQNIVFLQQFLSNIDGDLRTNYYKNHLQIIDFLQKAVYLNIKITIFKWK